MKSYSIRRCISVQLLTLCCLSAPVWAQDGTNSLTDRIIAQLIQAHAPSPLYQQDNNPWPGGSYTLEVFKNGDAEVSSGTASIRVKMPLRIVVAGSASNELLGVQLDCKASFTTSGDVTLSPRASGEALSLQSELSLPIPPVTADCGRIKLPLDSSIKALVSQKEAEWEARIDKQANALLMNSDKKAMAQSGAVRSQ